jgi:uncharacterized protein (TIGR02001 family)
MKISTKIIIGNFAIGLYSIAFSAHADVSLSVNLASDYVFEGVSQTNEKSALQGSVDYSHESGFYASVWASNVDFGGDSKGTEIDSYIGFAGSFSDSVGYNIGYINYSYVGDDNNGLDGYDFAEFYSSLTFMGNTTVTAWFDNDDTLWGGRSTRIKVEHSISLPDDYSLNLAFHNWSTESAIWDNKDSYNNYLIGVSKEFKGFAMNLNYTNSSIDNSSNTDGRIFFTIGRSF